MSIEYIRNYYGVPAKRGARIKHFDSLGTITGSHGQYIRVRFDGDKHSVPMHPTWNVQYLDPL